jgi:UDP-GlcNAc:undecaprenyl-phosphate GlcNAc-1-phosphate transferase
MRFLTALGVALVLVPLARTLGLVLGVVDRPQEGGLKIHRRAVSVLGGPAIIGATFVALAVTSAWPGWAVAGSIIGALAVGVVDDVRPLPPALRVGALAAAGGVLVAGGWTFGMTAPFGATAAVLLVLATCNAVNLADGQDGLAGGLGAIAAAGIGAVAIVGGGPGAGHVAGMAFAAAGAAVAFVLWNRPPAKIFLGNGGAYGLGALLASLIAMVAVGSSVTGVLAAGLCLGPFAFELIFTVARRVVSSTGLATGDREHSYDLLAGRGLTRPVVTLVGWGVGVAFVAAGVAAALVPLTAGIGIAVAASIVATCGGVWLWRGRTRGTVPGDPDGSARIRLDEPTKGELR